jgi:hypothetical protein
MNRALMIPILFVGGLVWLPARAAVNPGGFSREEITVERDIKQAKSPEVIHEEVVVARERKNAELKAIMNAPPVNFPHYVNPPFKSASPAARSDLPFNPATPLPVLFVKAIFLISAGTIVLFFIIKGITKPKLSPDPALTQRKAPIDTLTAR